MYILFHILSIRSIWYSTYNLSVLTFEQSSLFLLLLLLLLLLLMT